MNSRSMFWVGLAVLLLGLILFLSSNIALGVAIFAVGFIILMQGVALAKRERDNERAARNPVQQRLLIGAIAAGSLLHSLNHLYDDLFSAVPDPATTASLLGLVQLYLQ